MSMSNLDRVVVAVTPAEDRRRGMDERQCQISPIQLNSIAALPHRNSEASLADSDSVGLFMTVFEEDRLQNSFASSSRLNNMMIQESDGSRGGNRDDSTLIHAGNMGGTGGSDDMMEAESQNQMDGYQGEGSLENGSSLVSVGDMAAIAKGRFKEIKNLLIMLPPKTNLGWEARRVGFHVANQREFDLYRSYLTIHCGNTFDIDDNSRTIFFGDEMFLVGMQIARCAYLHVNGHPCLCCEEFIEFMFEKFIFVDKG